MPSTTLALLGLASVFVGFILRLVMPDAQLYAWGIVAAGALLLASAAVFDFRRLRGALGSRRGRVGIGATVKISLFAAILLLANAISVGTYHRFDFTSLAQFTLTSQTREVLAKLDTPVEIVSFFTPSVSVTVSGYARNLLAEYQGRSRELSVREVDPDLNPDEARRYQVDQLGATYGVTVFRGNAGQRLVYGPQITAEAEHAFTSAILEVTGTRQKKVYFLTGHGEASIYAGFQSARNGLRDNLFQVDALDLQGAPAVPADAAVVVVAGPRQAPVASELDALKTYVRGGGRVFLLLDPGAPQGFAGLIDEWGVRFSDGTIIDPSSYAAPRMDAPLVPRARDHFALAQAYFPGAAAIIPQEKPPAGLSIVPLVWTSPQSWLSRKPAAENAPKFDASVDVKGPLALGALVESKGTRLAVMADSDFAADEGFGNGNNGELFLTVVNWLAAGEEIISMDRRVLPVRQLILGPEEARFLFISSIGLLPVLLLLVGGLMWWRRR
jgi:ABC-type uncharacterized transport system involved in gliding motility auxiliary subunit